MIKFKNIVFILTVVFFSSCEKNDTVRDMGESEGFASNVYLEAQSDVLPAGGELKMPVTYWLPNEKVKSMSLRETKDSSFIVNFKQIAGSSFAYSGEIRGIIDSNKVYSTYEHSESNWSDAHTNYRIYATYTAPDEMKTLYFEGYDQMNNFMQSDVVVSEKLIDTLAYDYATQMTKDELHRSLVSVCTQDKFDDLWGGLTVAGADFLYDKIIKRNKSKDELLNPYFPYNDPIQKLGIKYLFGLSEDYMISLFCTKRPKLSVGNVVEEVALDAVGDTIFDSNGLAVYDTVWLDNTPYMSIDELVALYSVDIPTTPGMVFIENSIIYEKEFDADFDIEYSLQDRSIGAGVGQSTDPVYAKTDLENLFVKEKNFVVDNATFEGYFSGETINDSSIDDVVSDFKILAENTSNKKILGYKPKGKRYYNINLEFQVESESGIIGKSNIVPFKIK